MTAALYLPAADDGIVIIVVALLASVISPTILALITLRTAAKHDAAVAVAAKASKEEDWKRQDDVATRAQEAAALLATRTHESALRAEHAAEQMALNTQTVSDKGDQTALLITETLKLTAKAAAEATTAATEARKVAAHTDTQLLQIHTLVNSDMTAARRDQLDALMVLLGMTDRVFALQEKLGQKPREADIAGRNAAAAKIEELHGILADRLVQQQVVENEQAAAKAKADDVAGPPAP